MSLYKIINVGRYFPNIGNNTHKQWPSEEMRIGTLESTWKEWRPTVGMIGKVLWKFSVSSSYEESFVLLLEDNHYIAIHREGCEQVKPKQNKYTEKYIKLNGELYGAI